MSSILECLASSDFPREEKFSLLGMISTKQIIAAMPSAEFSHFKTKLNVLLLDPEKNCKFKCDVFAIITYVATHCSEDTFNDVKELWIRSAVANVSSDSPNLRQRAYLFVKTVLKRSAQLDTKGNFSGLIKKVMDEIIKTPAEKQTVISVECLSLILKKIQSVDKSQYDTILKFLNARFHCSSPREIEAVATCMCSLIELHATKFKEAWGTQFHKVLNTSYQIINELKKTVNIREEEIEGPAFEIPSESNSFITLIKLHRTFHMMSVCGAKMLSTTIASVTIPGKKILSLVADVITFVNHVLSAQNVSGGIETLASILPNVWVDALLLLEALILSCHRVLTQCEMEIFNIVTSSIVGLKNAKSQYKLPKAVAYQVLIAALNRMDECSPINHISEMMSDIESDAFPPNEADDLIVCDRMDTAELGRMMPGSKKKQENCLQALKVLSCVVLKQKKFDSKKLALTVLDNLRFLQSQPAYPAPFHDQTCRKELYHLLFSIVTQLHVNETMEIAKTICIFQRGTKDPCVKIARVCHWAATYCYYVCKGKKPPSMFPDTNLDFQKIAVPDPHRVRLIDTALQHLELINVPLPRPDLPQQKASHDDNKEDTSIVDADPAPCVENGNAGISEPENDSVMEQDNEEEDDENVIEDNEDEEKSVTEGFEMLDEQSDNRRNTDSDEEEEGEEDEEESSSSVSLEELGDDVEHVVPLRKSRPGKVECQTEQSDKQLQNGIIDTDEEEEDDQVLRINGKAVQESTTKRSRDVHNDYVSEKKRRKNSDKADDIVGNKNRNCQTPPLNLQLLFGDFIAESPDESVQKATR